LETGCGDLLQFFVEGFQVMAQADVRKGMPSVAAALPTPHSSRSNAKSAPRRRRNAAAFDGRLAHRHVADLGGRHERGRRLYRGDDLGANRGHAREPSLRQAGIDKAYEGITTLEQTLVVTSNH